MEEFLRFVCLVVNWNNLCIWEENGWRGNNRNESSKTKEIEIIKGWYQIKGDETFPG